MSLILSVSFQNSSVNGKEDDSSLQRSVVRQSRLETSQRFELNKQFPFSILLDLNLSHASVVFRSETGLFGPPVDHMILVVNIEGVLCLRDVVLCDSFLTPLLIGRPALQINDRVKRATIISMKRK